METSEKPCVLFSPVGMTDPIKGHKDGPLLHIVRYYRPKKVVLFLTGEIMERHKKDNRYCRTIRAVCPYLTDEDIQIIESPKDGKNKQGGKNGKGKKEEDEKVNKFELFDNCFRGELEKLHRDYPEHEILANVSSGTPQMEASLYVLAETLPFDIQLVQVHSPNPADHPDHFGPVEEELAALRETGPGDARNRTEALHTDNIQAAALEKALHEQLNSYDYSAAYKLIGSALEKYSLFTSTASELCRAANQRLTLRTKDAYRTADRAKGKVTFSFSANKEMEPLYEYLLMLDVLLKREAYGDYARAVSPAITAIMEKVAFSWLGKKKEALCKKDSKNIYRWSTALLLQNEPALLDYFKKLNKESPDFFEMKEVIVNSASLLNVLHYCKEAGKCRANDEDLKDFDDLRNFEENVRNLAAHTITAIDKALIEEISKVAPEDVREILHRQFEKVCNKNKPVQWDDYKPVQWDDYDRMNNRIFEALDRR